MGKVKQALLEDMMLNPENYNNPDLTEEEMDFVNSHFQVVTIPDHQDKDEIESIIMYNKRDTL